MLRVCISLSMALFLFSTPVQAGFEWLPPQADKIVPEPTVSHEIPVPISMPELTGYAAPPVIIEPIETAPLPIIQLPQITEQPVAPVPQQVTNLSGAPKSGLYINPYPLIDHEAAEYNSNASLTEAALAEQGGSLRPVQLGRNMDTGVKSYQGKRNTYIASQRQTPPRATIDGLTPIPGGEPEPLYEIEKAYGASGSSELVSMQYANAVGFGRDLPLALALSQVIPEGYTHSFAKDVDVGVTVSWEGGEPWNLVLNNMLREHDMTAIIRDKQVTIQPMAKL